MRKKSLLSMAAAVGMIALIGVGATFAYFSDTTEQLTNTFTLGKVEIELAEPNWKGDKVDIVPGQSFDKDPTVTVAANSVNSYVFMNVDGLDEMPTYFSIDGISSEWKKVDENETLDLDGVYVYVGETGTEAKIVEKSEEVTKLPPLFTKVSYAAEATEGSTTSFQIKVKAAAVQAEGGEGYSVDTAFEAIKDGIAIK